MYVATAVLTFLLLLETALAVAGVAVGGAAATGLATVFFLGFSFLAFFFGATAGAGVGAGAGAGAGGASAGGGAPVVWAHGHLSPLRHPAAEAKNAHGLDLSENRVYLLKGARG